MQALWPILALALISPLHTKALPNVNTLEPVQAEQLLDENESRAENETTREGK